MTTTVRITAKAQGILRELASRTGESMQDVLDKAIEVYRRYQILQETNQAYQILRSDQAQWAAELSERRLWDTTLADAEENK